MQVRAQRFQTELKLPDYRPAEVPEDEAKKQQRAARFGVEYTPGDKGALMEIGEQALLSLHSMHLPVCKLMQSVDVIHHTLSLACRVLLAHASHCSKTWTVNESA